MEKGTLVVAAIAHRSLCIRLLALTLLLIACPRFATAQSNLRSGMQPIPANGFSNPPSANWQSQPNTLQNNNGTVGNSPRLAEQTRSFPGPVSSNGANPQAAGTTTSSAAPGTAPAGTAPVRSLLQMFHDGGIMMYPLMLCSFVLTVFAFERFIHLRSGRVIPRPFVKRLIEQLQQQQIERDEAIELCERNPSPVAAIMSAALKRYGRPSVEVEQAALDAGERESNQLRRHMRLFNAISNISPLLGLLGTVLGMIQAFHDIASAQAMGRPELLAGGISQALLTTAAGLLVAIPAYLLYIYFVGHTDRLIMEMDKHAQRLVDAISAEGLQENDTSRSRSRSRKAA